MVQEAELDRPRAAQATDDLLQISATPCLADRLVVTVVGEVDPVSAPPLRRHLLRLLRGRPAVMVVRLDGVSFFDSAGAAALVEVHRRATAAGIEVRLATPSPAVSRVLTLTRLDTVLPVCPSLAQALLAPTHLDLEVGLRPRPRLHSGSPHG